MVQPLTLGEFDNLVTRHFGFLEKDFGFSFKRISYDAYRIESPNTTIHIFLEYGVNLVGGIEPAGEAAKQLLRQNIIPEMMTILAVCRYYDPKLKVILEPTPKYDIRLQMEKQAVLLKKHCQQMLKGDFSDWPEIKKYLRRHRASG